MSRWAVGSLLAVAAVFTAGLPSAMAQEAPAVGVSSPANETTAGEKSSLPPCGGYYSGLYTIGSENGFYGVGYRNCSTNGKWHRPVFHREGTSGYAPCVAAGEDSGYLGFMRSGAHPPDGDPYEHGELTMHIYTDVRNTCESYGEPMPPPPGVCDACLPPCPNGVSTMNSCDAGPVTVTARGRVEVWRNDGGSDTRGLSGARFEAVYFDGDQWQPLTDGPGGTGSRITDYLGQDGGYAITFPYPNRYRLPSGSWWDGCPVPGDGVEYAGAHACRATDIAIRVYPENESRSILVLPADAETVDPAWDAHIGRFFDEGDAPQQHVASSPAALAYGGTVNVLDLVGGEVLGTTRIRLHEGDGTSYYSQSTRTVTLFAADSGRSTTEHELGHQVHHNVFGAIPPAPNCNPHEFQSPSSPECAFQEALAHAVAVASENRPGEFSRTTITMGDGFDYDLENCKITHSSGMVVRCSTADPAARNAEGWVAGAFVDLMDNTPTESVDGLNDLSRYSFKHHFLPVLAEAKPKNFDQFWAAWQRKYGAKANDSHAAFLNHQIYAVKKDVSYTSGLGWAELNCNCIGKNARVLKPGATGTPSATWSFTGNLDPKKQYHIWVNNPSTTQADRDPASRFTVTSSAGNHTFTLNQNTQPGWTLLNPTTPVKLLAGDSLVLRSGSSPAKPIAADGVIVVPVG